MTASVPPDTLLDWFGSSHRDLPWRRPDVSAWQILISEIMLQQTPVSRVIEPWTQWVRRWPVPSKMAQESAGEVLRAWGKLGYPRRALRLHECSRVLADRFDDIVPADVDTLLTLPGIGDYTARAVACFAYGQPVPVVDVNVRRVVARAVHGNAQPGNPARRDLAETQALFPRTPDGSPAAETPTFSAALMELGALVCTAREARCDRCPLEPTCAWVRLGRPEQVGPPRRVQRFEGTDRQARGRLLDVLRRTAGPVDRATLDLAWERDPGQRARALDSLLVDGLIEVTDDGLYCLAGEAD